MGDFLPSDARPPLDRGVLGRAWIADQIERAAGLGDSGALSIARLLDGDTTPPAPRPQRPPEEADDAVWERALVRPVAARPWAPRWVWLVVAWALLAALALVALVLLWPGVAAAWEAAQGAAAELRVRT
jgi:hypothetical protein